MTRQIRKRVWALAVFGVVLAGVGIASWAQQAPEHGQHGTPEGWKFTWPAGNAVAGRDVFVKLECYSCHEVQGEQFPKPDPGGDPGKVGPELSQMAPLHTPEYFAEAIISPNAVVEEGKGYRAPDGRSKMPSYNDLVTIQEVIDLVAYLKGLRAVGAPTAPGGMPGSPGGHMMPGGQMPRH